MCKKCSHTKDVHREGRGSHFLWSFFKKCLLFIIYIKLGKYINVNIVIVPYILLPPSMFDDIFKSNLRK